MKPIFYHFKQLDINLKSDAVILKAISFHFIILIIKYCLTKRIVCYLCFSNNMTVLLCN